MTLTAERTNQFLYDMFDYIKSSGTIAFLQEVFDYPKKTQLSLVLNSLLDAEVFKEDVETLNGVIRKFVHILQGHPVKETKDVYEFLTSLSTDTSAEEVASNSFLSFIKNDSFSVERTEGSTISEIHIVGDSIKIIGEEKLMRLLETKFVQLNNLYTFKDLLNELSFVIKQSNGLFNVILKDVYNAVQAIDRRVGKDLLTSPTNSYTLNFDIALAKSVYVRSNSVSRELKYNINKKTRTITLLAS